MSGGQLFRPLHMNSFYRHMTIYIPVVTACPSYQADITKCCRVCFIIHMIESYRETVWERQCPVVSDRWVLAVLNKLHVAATTWKYRNNTLYHHIGLIISTSLFVENLAFDRSSVSEPALRAWHYCYQYSISYCQNLSVKDRLCAILFEKYPKNISTL